MNAFQRRRDVFKKMVDASPVAQLRQRLSARVAAALGG